MGVGLTANRENRGMCGGYNGGVACVGAEIDAAGQEAVARCLDRIGGAAASCGGRVATTKRDRAMILIATPAAPADAAGATHTALQDIPAVATGKLRLGIRLYHRAGVPKAN